MPKEAAYFEEFRIITNPIHINEIIASGDLSFVVAQVPKAHIAPISADVSILTNDVKSNCA